MKQGDLKRGGKNGPVAMELGASVFLRWDSSAGKRVRLIMLCPQA